MPTPSGRKTRYVVPCPHRFRRASPPTPFATTDADPPLRIPIFQVASDLISSAYATGENLRVLYSDSHRWFYLAHQAPNEFILLKCFDSARPDKIVPHTAFANEDARKGAPGRQSIEARCLVLYDH